jgi:hypothetical protein
MSDPRDSSRVVAYRAVTPEEIPADILSLLSLVCGVLSLLFRYKLAAWGALLASLGSIANLKDSELDYKQLFTSLSFSAMSLFIIYLSPTTPPPLLNNQ